ncbi:MAG: transposase [Candidatus Hydrogenedentes bacterium]|nr:transposase [Candidatus Hydrogenedentota bacterium]
MNSHDTNSFYRMRLPHWEVGRGIYFVTMHVFGSLPVQVMDELRTLSAQSQHTDEPTQWHLRRLAFRAMENALDHDRAIDYLIRPAIAELCMEAIRSREQRDIWHVEEYVLMPNHLHLLIQLKSGSLKPVMESFKRWTSRRALPLIELHRSFWQQEWFDHWSRSPEQDERIRAYIRNNPVKARLVKDYRDWPYGSWNDPGLNKNSP